MLASVGKVGHPARGGAQGPARTVYTEHEGQAAVGRLYAVLYGDVVKRLGSDSRHANRQGGK